jgi:hypothetical protein
VITLLAKRFQISSAHTTALVVFFFCCRYYRDGDTPLEAEPAAAAGRQRHDAQELLRQAEEQADAAEVRGALQDTWLAGHTAQDVVKTDVELVMLRIAEVLTAC